MSKFEFEFEIKELKLKVKSDRPNPSLGGILGDQIGNLLGAGAKIVDAPHEDVTLKIDNEDPEKSKRKRKKTGIPGNGQIINPALDWKHDPSKWGSPVQTWKTYDKGIWLLYVIEKELKITEATTGQLANSFNKHFKQAGMVQASNIARDFGTRKTGGNALLGENSISSPSTWFLTESGKKYAEKLIVELKTNGVS